MNHSPIAAYVPLDQRVALARGVALPDHTRGAALFADISGFTALTAALARRFGPRRGAEELARQLNIVYTALIAVVHEHGGSVIGFSGDAIACWYDAQDGPIEHASRRAVAAAFAMQRTMHPFAELHIPPDISVSLALKTAVASGTVRRFLVGDPALHVLDVLAGTLLDRMAAAEGLAQKSETVVDAETARAVESIVRVREWRFQGVDQRHYAVLEEKVENGTTELSIGNWQLSIVNYPALSDEQLRPWVLPTLYERLRSGTDRFVAELRPAAALFVKFGGLDYDTDPEAGSKLDAYIRWVQHILRRHEGSLIQLTTGDKGSYLYAAFGAPLAHDDDAARAVAAALELRSAPVDLPFITQVQIGVSQGRMRVGAYGSKTRRTYGVLGDATNLAARLMSRAAPGQILISQTVADAVRTSYQLDDLGLATFKGKSEPQPIHGVVQAQAQRAQQFRALYSEPLVGRADELAQVDTLLADAQDGNGHIVRIEGEAGVGKSHLAATIVQRAEAAGLRVAIGACQSTSRESAYFALRQMMRTLLGLPGALTNFPDEQQAQIGQIEAIVNALNPEWTLRLPLLGELLGLPIPDNETTAAFDAQLRQEALITLVLEIVQTQAGSQPVLLLLEDVHWMDEASQALTLALARTIARAPIVLLLLHRPPGADAASFYQELTPLTPQTSIHLGELSETGTAALVADRLGSDRIEPLALALIQALAQGNPFYTEELLDALQDLDYLLPINGAWTLAPVLIETLRSADCLLWRNGVWTLRADAPLAAVDLGIPDSIHGIVLSRLDRLPEPVKLTIKVASVIGRVFEFALLQQAHPTAPSETHLLDQVELMLARDFARIDAPQPELRYIFKHNITQEVVYRTLLSEQRHDLHRSVGETLEALQPDSIERLAHHFYNSDLEQPDIRGRALQYLGAAGDRARRDYANETALSYYNRALALEERPAWLVAKANVLHILGRRADEKQTLSTLDGCTDADSLEVALLHSAYHEALSEYDEAQQALESAMALSREQRDARGEVRSLIQAGLVAGKQGDFAGKQQFLERALACLPADRAMPDEETEIYYGLGIVQREHGEYVQAQAALERALELAHQSGNRAQEARILTALGITAREQRNFVQAYAYNEEALAIRTAIGDRAGEGASLVSLGQVLVDGRNDLNQAQHHFQHALIIQEAISNRWSQALIHNELGVVYNDAGDFAAAIDHLTRSLHLCSEIGAAAGRAYVLCNLGQSYRQQREFRAATHSLLESLALTHEIGASSLRAYVQSELALTHLAVHEVEDAIAQASASLHLYQEQGTNILTTSSLAVLALAHSFAGDNSRALSYAKQTVQILHDCEGIGPKYPQRDSLYCYQVFRANEQMDAAEQCLQMAYRLLYNQADKIGDPTMRETFLFNVSFNHEIQLEMQQYNGAALVKA